MARARCRQGPLTPQFLSRNAGEASMKGWPVPPVVIPAVTVVFFLGYGLFRAFL